MTEKKHGGLRSPAGGRPRKEPTVVLSFRVPEIYKDIIKQHIDNLLKNTIMIKTQLNFRARNYPYEKETMRLGFTPFSITIDADFKANKGDIFDPYSFYYNFEKEEETPEYLTPDEESVLFVNRDNLLRKYKFEVINVYYCSKIEYKEHQTPYIVRMVDLDFIVPFEK